VNHLAQITVELPGGRSCQIRCVRAPRGAEHLADVLVDIDLQSFVETTLSRPIAAAMLHHGEVFLLLADDDVIGAATCTRTWDPPDEAVLLTMGLRPGWRGRGLGQRFVVWVMEGLGAEGLVALNLLVGSDNVRALGLYRELGFTLVGEGPLDATSGERLLALRVPLESP
jgi:ribosomal protein S18 acetylase RimI-like enzyme